MNFFNYLAAFLLLSIAYAFYCFVGQNAVNVPYFDDYAYLEYVIKFADAPTIGTFLQELEFKHNGHGVITAKLAFWFDYLLTGQVNYRILILAGSLLIIGLFGYFYKVLVVNKIPFFFALPIGLFLFTPAYHENIFWAAALWQYTASFVVGIITYYLLAIPAWGALVGAVLGGYLLTYTNGNGLFGMYVGLLIPLMQYRYRAALVWLFACILTSIAFYWYYPFGFGSLNQEKSLKNSLLTLLSFFGAGALYLRGRLPEVAVLGAAISLSLLTLAFWVGGAFALSIVRNCSKNLAAHSRPKILVTFTQHPANLSLLALLGWLFITGLGVAMARAGQALETPARYMIYSVTAIVSLYVVLLLLVSSKVRYALAGGTTLVGAVFYLGTYLFAAPDVVNFRNSLIADGLSLRTHGRVSGKLETMTNNVTKKYFEESVKRGMYVLPADSTMRLPTVRVDSTQLTAIPMSFKVDTLPAYGGILIQKIANSTVSINQSQADNALFLLLTSDSTTYISAARQTPSRDRKMFLKTRNYFKEGFEAWVFQDNVPSGSYQLGLWYHENGQNRVVYTLEKLVVKNYGK